MSALYTRRRALCLTAAAAATITTPAFGRAHLFERTMALHSLHTGESVNTLYWADGTYIDDGLAAINWVLRDHRTDEVIPMDGRLIDQLHSLRRLFDRTRPFDVISGYRSPKTNAMLRQQGHAVAKRSLHMDGRAIDVRMHGVPLDRLRKAARSLEAGGVGYYPESDFVHLDTGRVRFW